MTGPTLNTSQIQGTPQNEGNPEPRQRKTREGAETRRDALSLNCCSVCYEMKPDHEFYLKDRNGRRDTTCKACRIIKQRERTLGVTQEDYLRMYTEQQGRCGICNKRLYSKRYKAFAVDHCHKTGRIRGLLCTKCNTGIGLFNDDPIALNRAIEWTKV
jgi:hypothetical protein